MSAAEWWANLPDNDVYTGREVKRLAVESGSALPENLSTVQAARALGFSPKWWAVRCRMGKVRGAFLDEAEHWRLPTTAARAYLASLQKTPNRSTRRGPSTPTARTGTEDLSAERLSIPARRLASVGRQPVRAPKPKGPRLA